MGPFPGLTTHFLTRGSRAFVAPGFATFAEARLPTTPPPGSFSCGLALRLRALRTPPRGDALPFGYRTGCGLVHEDFHLLPDRLSGVHEARLRGLPFEKMRRIAAAADACHPAPTLQPAKAGFVT